MLWRSCHFPFHAHVAALLWGNTLASAHNWFNWHLWYRDERQTEYVVNQFTVSMSVCKQQCTLLKQTLFYKHCDPSLQWHWYVTITHSTKFWLLEASFTSMPPPCLSHHMLWQIYQLIYLINSHAMSTQYYLKKCSTSRSVPVAIRYLSAIRENCQVPHD